MDTIINARTDIRKHLKDYVNHIQAGRWNDTEKIVPVLENDVILHFGSRQMNYDPLKKIIEDMRYAAGHYTIAVFRREKMIDLFHEFIKELKEIEDKLPLDEKLRRIKEDIEDDITQLCLEASPEKMASLRHNFQAIEQLGTKIIEEKHGAHEAYLTVVENMGKCSGSLPILMPVQTAGTWKPRKEAVTSMVEVFSVLFSSIGILLEKVKDNYVNKIEDLKKFSDTMAQYP